MLIRGQFAATLLVVGVVAILGEGASTDLKPPVRRQYTYGASLVDASVDVDSTITKQTNNEAVAKSQDALGCWGNTTDIDRILHGGTFDKADTAAMLETSVDQIYDIRNGYWKVVPKKLAREAEIPRCPKVGVGHTELENTTRSFLGEHAETVHAYLDKMLNFGPPRNEEPLIITILEGFNLSAQVNDKNPAKYQAKLALNFLCGMRRLQLDHRLVIFALDAVTNASLGDVAPTAKVLYHPGLLNASALAAKRTGTDDQGKNRAAKLLFPLLLLERGFPVILTDIDTYWVRDPSRYLLSLGAEMATGLDGCDNTLNSGLVHYMPVEGPKKVLRTALSMRKWQNGTHRLISDNDQYLLNCAHARLFVDGAIRSTTLPRPSFQFYNSPHGFVNFHCNDRRESFANLPFVFHTSGSNGWMVRNTTVMLQSIGFWDVDETDGGLCHAGVRDSSEQAQKQALIQGQNACRTSWHPKCKCDSAHWTPN